MKIGITADVNLTETPIINLKLAHFAPKPLVDVLVKNGVVPVILPILPGKLAKASLAGLDGLIIPGGHDIAAEFLHENPSLELGPTYSPRDAFEFPVVKAAAEQHLPLLGICRGAQVINAALGGTIYQDLPSEYEGDGLLQHSQRTKGDLPTHEVKIDPTSQLGKDLGPTAFVNSRHHQAVKEVAPLLKAVAQAPDGVIEAIENDDASVQAVQWHPENLWQSSPQQERLFTAFIDRIKGGLLNG